MKGNMTMCDAKTLLKDKTAIVTGAGRGIGKDIALALAKLGAKVVIVARTQADLDEVAGEIKAAGGIALPVSCDLTVSDQVSQLMEAVVQTYGKIDILVNNAGGYPSEIYDNGKQPVKIWEWTEEKWDRIIESNLKTTFLCVNKALPYMIKQESGQIVNMSSRMGRIASEMGAYAAAKSAIIALTKTVAIQAQQYGITANAVSPGILDTPGQRLYNASVGQDGIQMGTTKDVVDAVIYLLCYAPKTMTGQSLDLFKTV